MVQPVSVAMRLVGLVALVLLVSAGPAYGADFPTPSGKFTFEGKRRVGSATLADATITNGWLYLSGEYKWPPALFWPSALDYQRFTVVAKLRPENTSHGNTLLVGGTGHRWFVISTDNDGRVQVSFNNHEFRHPVESLTITNDRWITLALAFDLKAKRAVLYADGKRADEIVLPDNFDLAVINDAKWRDSDKHLTFTDGANGGTFRGLVAGLLTFDAILSPEQVPRLFPKK